MAKLAYSGVTSAVEKGLEQYLNTESPKEGLKHAVFYGFKGVITDYSDSADYVWTGVDAYRETPGSETDKAAAVAQALGTKYAIKWGTNKASEYLSGWLVQKGKPPGWTTSDSMEYARWKQQQEWDQALVKDWEDTYKACRRAELTRAPAADVDSLRQQLRAKSCAVNASYGAKVIMKHQVPPALSRGYAREMAAIHQEMVPELGQAMRGRGFAGPGGRDLEFQPIRNASSGDNVGVDHDLGLREQPDWTPTPPASCGATSGSPGTGSRPRRRRPWKTPRPSGRRSIAGGRGTTRRPRSRTSPPADTRKPMWTGRGSAAT